METEHEAWLVIGRESEYDSQSWESEVFHDV